MSPDYQDTITLIEASVDGYGVESVAEEAKVSAAVEFNTAWRHGSNQDAINSNAVVFVDPEDEFVIEHCNRLEGMLVIIPLFGAGSAGAWYRVTSCAVSRDHQLANEIDNIQLNLKKSAGISGVS